MDTLTKQPRKIFTVVIHDKEYDVYDIEGKEFDPGNGEPLTWWLYYGDRLPDGLLPSIDSDDWEHWHVGIQRHCWDIRFKQKNTTKEKWGSTQFSNRTSIEMWCNGKLFYSFGTTGTDRGMAFAMAKVQYLQVVMSEHPFNFYDPQSENGRKIYWYGLPATVKVHREEAWEIGIVPDYTVGLNKEEWWKEYRTRKSNFGQTLEDWEENREEENNDEATNYINWGDALSDQHIGWFRKDTKS